MGSLPARRIFLRALGAAGILLFLSGCFQPVLAPPKPAGGPDPSPGPGWRVSNPRAWRYIIIHHSATPGGNTAEFDRMHRQKGWRGVGYDFVIGNGTKSGDGEVEVTFRWKQQIDGAHAGVPEYNKWGIGICLVGNFEVAAPSRRQMDSLVRLVRYLQQEYRIPRSRILGHRDVRAAGTLCPGRRFPMAELKSRALY